MTNVLGLASAMMPAHPHAAAWRRQEAAFQIAAFSTAADAVSPLVVNGRPLREWLAGWNVAAYGMVAQPRHRSAPGLHGDRVVQRVRRCRRRARGPTDAADGRARRGARLQQSARPEVPLAAVRGAGRTVYLARQCAAVLPGRERLGARRCVPTSSASTPLPRSWVCRVRRPRSCWLHAQALLDMQARSPGMGAPTGPGTSTATSAVSSGWLSSSVAPGSWCGPPTAVARDCRSRTHRSGYRPAEPVRRGRRRSSASDDGSSCCRFEHCRAHAASWFRAGTCSSP